MCPSAGCTPRHRPDTGARWTSGRTPRRPRSPTRFRSTRKGAPCRGVNGDGGDLTPLVGRRVVCRAVSIVDPAAPHEHFGSGPSDCRRFGVAATDGRIGDRRPRRCRRIEDGTARKFERTIGPATAPQQQSSANVEQHRFVVWSVATARKDTPRSSRKVVGRGVRGSPCRCPTRRRWSHRGSRRRRRRDPSMVVASLSSRISPSG